MQQAGKGRPTKKSYARNSSLKEKGVVSGSQNKMKYLSGVYLITALTAFSNNPALKERIP